MCKNYKIIENRKYLSSASSESSDIITAPIGAMGGGRAVTLASTPSSDAAEIGGFESSVCTVNHKQMR
jgi:hypothetical protein